MIKTMLRVLALSLILIATSACGGGPEMLTMVSNRVYASPGTYTFTPTTSSIYILMKGPGGGGGGGGGGPSIESGGAGGGGSFGGTSTYGYVGGVVGNATIIRLHNAPYTTLAAASVGAGGRGGDGWSDFGGAGGARTWAYPDSYGCTLVMRGGSAGGAGGAGDPSGGDSGSQGESGDLLYGSIAVTPGVPIDIVVGSGGGGGGGYMDGAKGQNGFISIN